MKIQTYNYAGKLLNEIYTLNSVHQKLKDGICQGSTFNLHSDYFDQDFIDNINAQVDAYLKRKIEKSEAEFESL